MANKSSGNMITGIAVGAIVATAITMVVTGKSNIAKKAKSAMSSTAENVSSMLKP